MIKKYYIKSDEHKEKVKNERTTKFFNIFCEYVEKNKGKCNGTQTDYTNAHSKIDVECKNNHKFQITLNNIKGGRWCKLCSRCK